MSLKKTVFAGLLLSTLSGCNATMSNSWFAQEQPQPAAPMTQKNPYAVEQGFEYQPDIHDHMQAGMEYEQRHAQSVFVHKRLSDYADQLAMLLMERAFTLKQSDKITVASFVRFDSSLRQPTNIGNRLAEVLIRELQHYGLTVIDTKLSTEYTITPRGDLALSRDRYLLKQEINVDYIVTGTLVDRPNGVEVNARIIGVDEQNVAASANLFIPSAVVNNESQYSSVY